jgi:hypothetical protein
MIATRLLPLLSVAAAGATALLTRANRVTLPDLYAYGTDIAGLPVYTDANGMPPHRA